MEDVIRNKLNKIKNLVCLEKKYRLSKHVINDYLKTGKSSIHDIEYCIQNSKTINGIREDKMGTATDGKLYKIIGRNKMRNKFYTAGKFIKNSDNEELYFFITAHKIEG
ncbi:MAG: hypothetical protein K9N00_03905 [Candidatus Marinimicrobia bacterium]|nr:hypothetical protein [Candidatus Neomarinimicrobiota bacterium]